MIPRAASARVVWQCVRRPISRPNTTVAMDSDEMCGRRNVLATGDYPWRIPLVMRAKHLDFTRQLAVLTLCLFGSSLLLGEEVSTEVQPPELVAAASKAAQLKQLARQAAAADAEAAKAGVALTDAQLAERVVREERILAVRKELTQVLANADGRSADEVAADRQMAEELSKAASSEEREVIIARHRAYRRVMTRLADTAATVSQN
jgi:hypothetical protein